MRPPSTDLSPDGRHSPAVSDSPSLGARRLLVPVVLAVTAIVAVGAATPAAGSAPSVPGGATGETHAAAGGEPTPIRGCTNLTEPGRYVLVSDFGANTTLSTSCIEIRASDVVVDGNGHALRGNGITDTTGVYVNGTGASAAANVTVRDLSVSRFNRGIAVEDATGTVVEGVNVTGTGQGVALRNADGASVVDSRLAGNLLGVRADRATVAPTVRGNDYRHNAAADLRVAAVLLRTDDVLVSVGPPADVDDDGRYEDLDGDGERTVGDGVALAALALGDAVGVAELPADLVARLDRIGDGALDAGDVLAAFGLR